MSVKTPFAPWSSFGRQALVIATLAIVTWGVTAPVMAQEVAEKTVGERLKDYWDKLIAKMESSARAAGDEYHKLKDEAAKESGPAREKLAAEMEHLSRKWAIAREKLATAIELRMNSLHEEVHELEEKADKATGPAREKMHAEMHKLHGEWTAARAKMEATLSANLNSSREEIEHLKEHASNSAKDAKAKLAPRMERLKAEFHKNRDKLSAYLESDLEHTKADLEKLREATSNAAKLAKEKLTKKFHELQARHEELAKEKAAEEAN
jgi:polyhydroxyalkanoate synthesis regulator phasin